MKMIQIGASINASFARPAFASANDAPGTPSAFLFSIFRHDGIAHSSEFANINPKGIVAISAANIAATINGPPTTGIPELINICREGLKKD